MINLREASEVCMCEGCREMEFWNVTFLFVLSVVLEGMGYIRRVGRELH
jgi:hypothetical protein